MNAQINNMMTLSELLQGLVHSPIVKDVAVTGVSEYSDDVDEGDVFIALGNKDYCTQAIENGAVAIVCDAQAELPAKYSDSQVPIIVCENLKHSVNEIIERFYLGVAAQINTIAITGTDGKSSVAHLVAQALEYSQDKCGLIGTLGYGRLQELSVSSHTTPPPARLAKEYKKLDAMGCDLVALEASSHGIHQQRLRNLTIHTAVLTNITRDHLDYHKTIDAYIEAKAALFFKHKAKYAVINWDDNVGRQWCQELSKKLNLISYSLSDAQADVYASSIEYQPSATALDLVVRKKLLKVRTTLLGEFNVLNILAVAAVLVCQGKTNDEIALALNKLDAVPGRMQCIEHANNFSVIVDYAHTPAALAAALHAVRDHCQGRLICVFGCGGQRDQGKRAPMGEVAVSQADYVVITSDNPRNESPELIIQQIIQGCEGVDNFTVIIERQEAIAHAISMAKDTDAVLIAGKGHEKFQYINDQSIEFDDVVVATKELQRIAHA